MNRKIFEQKIEQFTEKKNALQKTFSLLGNLKLACAFGIIFFGYYSLRGGSLVYNVLFVLLVGVFIYLAIKQSRVKKDIDYSSRILEINKRYLKRLEGTWSDFEDSGIEFLDKEHDFSYDLDIFGKKSLFQFINVSHTYLGRIKLANYLSNPKFSPETIAANQEATKELFSKPDFCQNLEAFSQASDDNADVLKIINYLKDNTVFYKNKIIKAVLHFMPLIFAPVVFAIYIFGLNDYKLLANIMLIIQLIIWGVGFSKINAYLYGISHYSMKLAGYKSLFSLIQKEEFVSQKLRDIKKTLFEDVSAFDAFSDLDKITQKISARNNALVYFILNIILLWDYECCAALEQWKEKYSSNVEKYFESIAEIEVLISFSVLNHVLNNCSYPEIDNKKMDIEGTSLGHPLINNEKRVNNSFAMKDQILIISGSNMSGKTTFLRTIGINLVLAYNGAVVCGEFLKAPVLDILTSMRISDDLGEGISTFYAELLKIKKIVTHSKNNKQMIFLIDEIFRGTNSEDRLFGARTVVEDLNRREVIGLITTHDLEICNLEINERIVNYHFKEDYLDEKIIFDYKLTKGVSQTTNGKHLMKMVGITV